MRAPCYFQPIQPTWDTLLTQAQPTLAEAQSLAFYPAPYSVSPTFTMLRTPWFLDYSHLTFWFFFFSTFVIVVWIAYTFVGITQHAEQRRPVRETRGFSRAQTGDTLTAVLPLTWSVTMLAHAGTHSTNFDENTTATAFSFTVIAYQWGWNYYFPREIAELLTSAPRLVGHGCLATFSATDSYAALLAQARFDFASRQGANTRYAAKHGRRVVSNTLNALLPTLVSTDNLAPWTIAGVMVAATSAPLAADAALLAQATTAVSTQSWRWAAHATTWGAPSRLLAAAAGSAGGARVTSAGALPAPFGGVTGPEPLSSNWPSKQQAQGFAPISSLVLVGNRLRLIHQHLASAEARRPGPALNHAASVALRQLAGSSAQASAPCSAAVTPFNHLSFSPLDIGPETPAPLTWLRLGATPALTWYAATGLVGASDSALPAVRPATHLGMGADLRASTLLWGQAAPDYATRGARGASLALRAAQFSMRGVQLSALGGETQALTEADLGTNQAASAAESSEAALAQQARLAGALASVPSLRAAALVSTAAVGAYAPGLLGHGTASSQLLWAAAASVAPATTLHAVGGLRFPAAAGLGTYLDGRSSASFERVQLREQTARLDVGSYACLQRLHWAQLTLTSEPTQLCRDRHLPAQAILSPTVVAAPVSAPATLPEFSSVERLLTYLVLQTVSHLLTANVVVPNELVTKLFARFVVRVVPRSTTILPPLASTEQFFAFFVLNVVVCPSVATKQRIADLAAPAVTPRATSVGPLFTAHTLRAVVELLQQCAGSLGKRAPAVAVPESNESITPLTPTPKPAPTLTTLLGGYAPVGAEATTFVVSALAATTPVAGPRRAGLHIESLGSRASQTAQVVGCVCTLPQLSPRIAASLEGLSDVQPTRAAAVEAGEPLSPNTRGQGEQATTGFGFDHPRVADWRFAWAWHTSVAGLPWDQQYHAQFSRRPRSGVSRPRAEQVWLSPTSLVPTLRQRFDKVTHTALLPTPAQSRQLPWYRELAPAVLDLERVGGAEVQAVLLPLPNLDLDVNFLFTRWAAEVNTSRRSDHNARYGVSWGPLASVLGSGSFGEAGLWPRTSGPAAVASLAASTKLATFATLATGERAGVAVLDAPYAQPTARTWAAQPAVSLAVSYPTITVGSGRASLRAGARWAAHPLAPLALAGAGLPLSPEMTRDVLGGSNAPAGSDLSAATVGLRETLSSWRDAQPADLSAALVPNALAVPLALALGDWVVRKLEGPVLDSAESLVSHTGRPEACGGYARIQGEVGAMRRLRVTKGVYLPSDTPMHGIFGSKDVIHSWAIPGLGVKIDCIPGYSSHRRLLLRWRGLYWGQCMEVCGRYHHWMPILVRVVHRDIFLVWCLTYIRLLAPRKLSGAGVAELALARDAWAVISQTR